MTAAIERFPGKFPIVGDVMNRTEEIRDGQLERTRYSTIHTRRGKFMTLMYLKTVGNNSIRRLSYACTNLILYLPVRSKGSMATKFILALKKSRSAATTETRSWNRSCPVNFG